MATHGGKRQGAGRKKGSRNKTTIARMSAAEVLGVEDVDVLEQEVHRRGHSLLLEMERLVLDPTQPVGVRIMAARTALPFLLPRREAPQDGAPMSDDLLTALEAGRERARLSSHG
ncbi:hypothetical protein ACQ5SP_03725 [Rhodovulum sp. YNF3179]|uniref:hypothetical protein n=1 Tax=Rhodovulum sp. YNF3179 TaxID=3425127 RepID=UPI003D3468C2